MTKKRKYKTNFKKREKKKVQKQRKGKETNLPLHPEKITPPRPFSDTRPPTTTPDLQPADQLSAEYDTHKKDKP